MFGLETKIAFRYLRARHKDGVVSLVASLSLVGIILGVATLIVVMSVMNGFRQELLSRILGINGHVTLYQYGAGGIAEYESLLVDLAEIDGVKSAVPLIDSQVMVTYRGYANGALVKGMRSEDVRAMKPLIADTVRAGSFDEFASGNGIMLGVRLAEQMGVKVGDVVTLVSPEANATVVGMVPRMKEYVVVALFEVGMYEYDSSTIVMSFEQAQVFFKYKGASQSIELMADDGDMTGKLVADILYRTGGKYQVVDWKASNAHFFNALDTERAVMFLILTLIIAIAAFNIFSSLVMLVNEKASNIAILRTMGASKSMVMRIFMIAGTFIGFLGAVLGVLLGVGFAENITSIQKVVEGAAGYKVFDPVVYFLSELPAELNVNEAVAVFLVAVGLSFLATIIPALMAARREPGRALASY